jgi:hypothetical protein
MSNPITKITQSVSLTLQVRRENKRINEATERILMEQRIRETLGYLYVNGCIEV